MVAKRRILIVEDDPRTRALLRDTLQDDFAVDEADTGADALRVAATRQYDLALLDVELAEGQSGYSLCAGLRRLPQGQALKIVFLTGLGGVTGRSRGVEAGADAYVTKPFSPTALLAQLHELLSLSRLGDGG